jgi:hypothetical protein
MAKKKAGRRMPASLGETPTRGELFVSGNAAQIS